MRIVKILKTIFRRIKNIGEEEPDSSTLARQLGAKVGENCVFIQPPRAALGSEPYLVSLGNDVEITDGVHFITHNGSLWTVRRYEPELSDMDEFAPIKVGNNVMIGMNSVIMPGVTIGSNVIIGACSFVNKDIPSNVVAVGSPAKPISTIDEYVEKLKAKGTMVATKHMNPEEKRLFLKEKYSEWFN